jgi:alkylated DNA repair dioxygenase AlkB
MGYPAYIGHAGCVTDRTGYRYTARDPETDRPWPAMPEVFSDLAARAAPEPDSVASPQMYA